VSTTELQAALKEKFEMAWTDEIEEQMQAVGLLSLPDVYS